MKEINLEKKNCNLVIISHRKFEKILRKFMEKLFQKYVILEGYFLKIQASSTEILGKSKNKFFLHFLIK